MKKIISMLLLTLLIFTGFAGCSTPNKKPEAELKEKINTKSEAQAANESKASTGQSAENDITKGYTYKVEGGSLELTYKNTGNMVTLVKANENYDYYKTEGDNVSTHNTKFLKVLSVKKSDDDYTRLYITIAGEPGGYPATYNMDLKDRKIYWVGKGGFVKEIEWDKYTTYAVLKVTWEGNTEYSVYDITENRGEKICDLGAQLSNDIIAQINRALDAKLSQFGNETINDVQVNYSDYYSVIIPMYYGANISALESVSKVIGSPSGSYQTMELNFAVFGELKDTVVTYFEGMDSDGISTEMGTLSNTNVNLTVYAPSNDMTYLKVTGKAYIGKGEYKDIEFTLDDMRDATDFEVIM